ncbi:MAG: phosphoglycerate kinase [Candidatus Bathyarchaeota archaeon]|nr:phosphoglycerate kinase [Candidatus Bathyarchaeota archaeon]
MVYDFLTLDDVELAGKTVFLRADINSPLDPNSKRILDASRIQAVTPTIKTLKDSKLVIGAHQSRPGRYDFTSLELHAKVLQMYLEQEVKYTDDVIGEDAQQKIKDLKNGEVLVLNNVRMLEEENKVAPLAQLKSTEFVKVMSPLFDYFVNDAFAAAHRSQPSLVGLSNTIPMVAGRLMEKELTALNKVLVDPNRPSVYLLGGVKVEDRIPVIKRVLGDEIADSILLGGQVSNSFYMANGLMQHQYKSLDEERKKLVEQAASIMEEFPSKIQLPIDVALDVNSERVEIFADKVTDERNIYDIGLNTIAQFSHKIMPAKTVVAEGPLGMFERRGFDIGTKELLRCISRCTGYTVVGGGHMGGMASMLGITEEMSHVSTGGGAMLSMLAGETLPVVAALEASKKRYR